MLRYLMLWFPMLLIAIFNGALRDLGYKRAFGELRAQQLSTLTLLLFFTLYIGFVLNRFPPASGVQAAWVGVLWLVLTLAFEFGFGRYQGRSWPQLLADYHLLRGRLWLLVPLWVALAPYLFYKLAKG
ncbi:hypothetical protein [Flaviaesturariibacter aridisoli]|uniref:Uncharacterized protein n=1 Tax=Flaviaesturariibacter aridisoli TaxID=2545761 RepID=A0A4R4E3T9_9BACT|nr:hypothetical protein [Flaviaesturariibacter aridisoli]TCZ73340.1 hypothetical protein E0486_06615 [Flaviaesturariibacter aridisoli]